MKIKCFSYEKADWSLIPEHMQSGLKLYIEEGIRPGSFMEAVLCNDLAAAFGRADFVNRHRVLEYVQFLYSYAPAECWHSMDAVEAWIEQGGLNGRVKEQIGNTDAGGENAPQHDDSEVR